MATREHEMRFLMPRQREGRRLVCLKIVASVAGIEVWRRGKLVRMPVAVTIGAALEFYLEQRLFPFGMWHCAHCPGERVRPAADTRSTHVPSP